MASWWTEVSDLKIHPAARELEEFQLEVCTKQGELLRGFEMSDPHLGDPAGTQ